MPSSLPSNSSQPLEGQPAAVYDHFAILVPVRSPDILLML